MVLFLCLIGALIALWYIRERADAKRRLPGPMQFPIFGSMFQVAAQDPVGYIALSKLGKKYGHAMAVRLGIADFVFLQSSEAIKDFYGGEDCIDRPCDGVWAERNFYKNLGIIFSNGQTYNEIKKFSTQAMRSFGFLNRTWLSEILKDEIDNFMHHLDEEIASNPKGVVEFTPSGSMKDTFTNLICAMIESKRYNYSDPRLRNLVKALDTFFRTSSQGVALMTSFPIIRFIFGKYVGYYDQVECMRGVNKYTKEVVAERRLLGIYKTEAPACFVDAFLKKMEDTKHDPNTLYTDEQLIVTVTDFFTAGSETTANWMLFGILLLTTYPDKQKKMYEELRRVIGDRLPEIEDKSSLIYAQAVMMEIHRWSMVSISISPRMAVKDFEYEGRIVKKGTTILGNQYPIMYDKEYWGDPHVFRPERFLDANGQFTKTERVSYAFGTGKRVCFGEVLAKESGYLYLTTMIQRYELSLPEEYNEKPPDLSCQEGITICPADYRVKMVKRV